MQHCGFMGRADYGPRSQHNSTNNTELLLNINEQIYNVIAIK